MTDRSVIRLLQAVVLWSARSVVFVSLVGAGLVPRAWAREPEAPIVPSLAALVLLAAALACLTRSDRVRYAAGLARRRAFLVVFLPLATCLMLGTMSVVTALTPRSVWAGLGLFAALCLPGLAAALVDEPDDLDARPAERA